MRDWQMRSAHDESGDESGDEDEWVIIQTQLQERYRHRRAESAIRRSQLRSSLFAFPIGEEVSTREDVLDLCRLLLRIF